MENIEQAPQKAAPKKAKVSLFILIPSFLRPPLYSNNQHSSPFSWKKHLSGIFWHKVNY
jgi:hypothetical protein